MMRAPLLTFAISALVFSCAAASEESTGAGAAVRGDGWRRSAATLATGGDHTCALARYGVKCWGRNSSQQLAVPALTHPTAITAGSNHTCAIDDTGVKCWGQSTSGQITVPALSNPRQVSAGMSHTCAIDDSGAKCWGLNANGQSTVPALVNPHQIGAGGFHTCALDDEGVKCWGRNTNGQATPPALVHPTRISVGNLHTCAIDDEGVKCWGSNTSGQTTVPPLRHPTQIEAGSLHTCAIDDDGVKCWGSNSTSIVTGMPVMTHATLLRSGRSHACAIDDDTIKCWGTNLSGQTTVPPDADLVGRHLCALANGSVRCAGENERGQLGAGNDADQPGAIATGAATDLGQGFTPVELATGRAFDCARSGGTVKCWGWNSHGQLGLGDTRDRGVAAGEMGDGLPALAFGRAAITKVAAGDGHACSLSAAGEIFCWGRGSSGQLGTESTADATQPTRPHVRSGLVFRDIALGKAHTCAATTEGAVYCFGANDAGQLGLGRAGNAGDVAGTMGDGIQPVALGDGFKAASVAAGDRHSCAVSQDGRVKCWGANGGGELGLGDIRDRGISADDLGAALPPLDLGHGQVVTSVACGSRHCCAKTIQNTTKCWGDNGEGQLGLGDVTARGKEAGSMGDSLPFVMLPPHERVLSVDLEGDRTCVRSDSGLRCWGRNRAGELGYGDKNVRGSTLTTVPRLLSPLGI